MNAAQTYWMYTNEQGNLELTSIEPSNGKLYIAVTPDFLRRAPIAVCEAPTDGDSNHNTYYIRGDISSIYTKGSDTALSVLMFLASQNSVDGEEAKICFLPKRDSYPLKTISDTGFERDICKGDIVANKVCFIRYNPITQNIILINPSMDKEASLTNLNVYGEALFNVPPRIRKEIPGDTTTSPTFKYVEVASKDDLATLIARLDKLERKFLIGVGDPVDMLEGAENGTIYLRLGDILN